MPLYEYYCEACNAIYEALRPIREAALPVPCPECSRDGRRIMSTFTAFSYRDGYPRRLPDKGTYWHLGKEVKTLPKRMQHNEHPELAKPKPAKRPTKGEKAEQTERAVVGQKEKKRRARWGVSEQGYPTKK